MNTETYLKKKKLKRKNIEKRDIIHNMSKEKKQKLKEYQKKIKIKNFCFCFIFIA